MKSLDIPMHPDVAYWTCPHGDVRVLVSGTAFFFMTAMGMEVEMDDLSYALPDSTLGDLETAVEEHEATHD